MKFKSYITLAAALILGFACKDGYIDEIEPVAPGADESSPMVMINYPTEGTLIRVLEDVATIQIKFEVTDDIEIGDVKVQMDGAEIGAYSDFVDYRRAVITLPYDQLTNGPHVLKVTAADLSGKNSEQSVNFEKAEPYQPSYDGEIAYIPFDGDYLDLVSLKVGTEVGNPGFTTDKIGGTNSYAGATGAYVTYPASGFFNEEFSASFWYKINASPDRGSLLVISPPDTGKPDNLQNNRTGGFRLFREGSATRQVIKLNVGNGTADSWFDGGDAAAIDPTKAGWVHIAFTISKTECAVYLDGKIASKGPFTGVSWTGCNLLSVMSGAPRFVEWGHLSDASNMDELRIFNKALTQTEIQTIIADERP